MYAIAFLGILMILLSAVMAVDPDYWLDGIVAFSRAKYFHGFEIISRLAFGVVFIKFSEQTLYPAVIGIFGYLMVAVWAAMKFNKIFRLAGIVSIMFGIFIAYSALNGP